MNKFANRLIGVLLLTYPAMLSWYYGFFDTWLGEQLMEVIVMTTVLVAIVACSVLVFLLAWVFAVAVWELIVHGELK